MGLLQWDTGTKPDRKETPVTVQFQLAFHCSRVRSVKASAGLEKDNDVKLERCLFNVHKAHIAICYVPISASKSARITILRWHQTIAELASGCVNLHYKPIQFCCTVVL